MDNQSAREIFLRFFEGKRHRRVPSSSLIPQDPSVLLTMAGMLQFKPIFLGEERPTFPRATSVQKCIRTTDIERVGVTPRHLTFFEMLGNFSFGDYFKEAAIEWAWALLTEGYRLPQERLWIAVFREDDEAATLWEEKIGMPRDKIFRLDEENNFWSAGPVGPCGPCSEIYYDTGLAGCGESSCGPGCDCDRFLEIWNLVFIQYNRDQAGKLHLLPAKHIDTGMGFERILTVLQGVAANFETDVLAPLVQAVQAQATHRLWLEKGEADGDHRLRSDWVVADHSRAIAYLIADGVRPASAGRGYVLRRLIRRGLLHGQLLGIREPIFPAFLREVIEMGSAYYPELFTQRSIILEVVGWEEQQFSKVLAAGRDRIERLLETPSQEVDGGLAFHLFDTFGIPLEFIEELAQARGKRVDRTRFDEALHRQQERSRKQITEEKKMLPSFFTPSQFLGYDTLTTEARVVCCEPCEEDSSLYWIGLDQTPFYPEGGGQVGDRGILVVGEKIFSVLDTVKNQQGTIFHLTETTLPIGSQVRAEVDASLRASTARHHTATHLLHAVLRKQLGEHVMQAGSLVAPARLRFDFSHPEGLGGETIRALEGMVNDQIRKGTRVEKQEKPFDVARAEGAIAFFDEKYGDRVRVVSVESFSKELCGGTHVDTTSDIGWFTILSERAIAAGIRRIEALASDAAEAYWQTQLTDLLEKAEGLQRQLNGSLDQSPFHREQMAFQDALRKKDWGEGRRVWEQLCREIETLEGRVREAQKAQTAVRTSELLRASEAWLQEMKPVAGVPFVANASSPLTAVPGKVLKELADHLLNRLQSGVVVLVATEADRFSLVVKVSEDWIKQGINAGKMVAYVSSLFEGKGGGKPTLAQGGGKQPSTLTTIFSACQDYLHSVLSAST